MAKRKKNKQMKTIFKLLMLSLLISCNIKPDAKNQTDKFISLEKDSTIKITNTDSINNLENTDDCIFDQTTQTDKFLKNIEELKNYKWDYDSRTATIILDNGDSLLITRGGCYDFGVSAEFRLTNDKTDYSNWKNVYDKALWIAKTLDKEFAYEEIKNSIDSNNIIIEKVERGEIVYFTNEFLQDNHYEIFRKLDNELKVIILSYYRN